MAVGLLDRAEQEHLLSSSSNAKLSYSEACLLDSQNMDEKALMVVKQYTLSADDINSYERARFHSHYLGNKEDSKENHNNSAQMVENCNVLFNYLKAGQLLLDLHLFRGTSLERFCDSIAFGQVDNDAFLSDCKNIEDGGELTNKYGGEVFTYGQHISTSIRFDVACEHLACPTQCMLKISAPKGTPARCIQEISERPEEKEVLVISGTQFRILKIRPQKSGIKEIYVEVVVNPPAKSNYDSGNGYG